MFELAIRFVIEDTMLKLTTQVISRISVMV
jgi:hypothetical protein